MVCERRWSKQLLRGGIGSLFTKAASMLLTLTLTILLARTIGAEGYGIYSYVFALVSILAIPAQLGLPTLVVRETAKAGINEEWASIKGIWHWADVVTGILSGLLLLVSGAIVWWFSDYFTSLQIITFIWGILLVPLIALGNLRAAALRGLRHVVQGQLFNHVLRLGLLSFFVIFFACLSPQNSLTASQAMALHVFAAALAFAVSTVWLRCISPSEIRRSISLCYKHRIWLSSIIPLALFSSMQLIKNYTDILMLGYFSTATDVGIYRIAVQGASLVAFGLGAANMVVAPYFSQLYAQGNKLQLQKILTMSTRAILGMAIPVVLVLVLFGQYILSFVFGNTYAVGATALSILSIGQLVNAAMGSVGLLLNMAGYERYVAKVSAITAVLNLVLNFVLIPPLGMSGAAIATSIALATWNIMLWYVTKKHLGINSTAFTNLRSYKI